MAANRRWLNHSTRRAGILFKSSEALQRMQDVTAIVLDKTGTVTSGQLAVTEVITTEDSPIDVLRMAASAERGSEHPIAEAIVTAAPSSIAKLGLKRQRATQGTSFGGPREIGVTNSHDSTGVQTGIGVPANVAHHCGQSPTRYDFLLVCT